MRFPLTLLVASLVLLQGCNSATWQQRPAYGYSIPAGAVLELHQSLEVKPGYTRRFLQSGEAMDIGDRNRFATSCNFEIRDLDRQKIQSIQPGSVVVTRIGLG